MKPVAAVLLLGILCTDAATVLPGREISDPDLDGYFRAETRKLAERCLTKLPTASEWQSELPQRRAELREMLGLQPLPPRGDLKALVTGRTDRDSFIVENVQFQSLPGLYVTGNLYLPRGLARTAPTVLYVCGHSPVVTNGLSYGNKTAYQHHGIWFAENGYVCLVVDTLQLGEIQGLHHGTYRAGMWWWNSRGYSPGGVEAWNSMRALDYLSTRPEVDTNRFAITGRSGGGAYSWYVAALDERIKAAAPVAGITDLENYVSDGCVEGHCDCMFFVNTYRWDYPMLAALCAPRPLLLCNTDSDTIFPLDGVVRLHEKVRRVYSLLGAETSLGLVITPGPHKDTQELQVPVLRWFNKYLKGEQPLLTNAAAPRLAVEDLRVFRGSLPADALNTNIHDTFVPVSNDAGLPPLDQKLSGALLARLREKCFASWPEEGAAPELKLDSTSQGNGGRLYEIESQPFVRLRLRVDGPANPDPKPRRMVLRIASAAESPAEAAAPDVIVATLFVRGIGPNAWPGDAKKEVQIRRRFMLLGETMDSMRVWDIRRGIQAVRAHKEFAGLPLEVEAGGAMAVNARFAMLFEPNITARFSHLPTQEKEMPDYLNVDRVVRRGSEPVKSAGH